jgi:hypothetical protein
MFGGEDMVDDGEFNNLTVNNVLTLSGGETGASPTPLINLGTYYDNSGNPSASHISLYHNGLYGFGVSSGNLDILTDGSVKISSDTNYDAFTFEPDNYFKITLGGDVNLYRSGTDLLRTDDIFQAYQHLTLGAGTSSYAFVAAVDGDSVRRFVVTCKGGLSWGDGTNSRDVTLYRSAENTLRTDDRFHIVCPVSAVIPEYIKNQGWLWHYTSGIWDPSGMPIESTTNYIALQHPTLLDPNNNNQPYYADWTLAMIDTGRQDYPYWPILYTHSGMMIQRDLSVGGFVASWQGALAVGHGLNKQMDPPQIWLMDGYTSVLNGIVYQPDAPENPKHLQLFICNTDQNPNYEYFHLYEWDAVHEQWTDLGPTSDYQNQYFDTLHITKYNGSTPVPANLDLGDLTVHGGIVVGNYGISSAGDAIFNSVLGTASGAFKVGTTGGTTYVSLTRSGSTGYITAHYGTMYLVGNSGIRLTPSGGTVYCEGAFSPTGAGSYNQGSSGAYWNEVNAKSFPDRGCPIWIEPQEAREILKGIKPHPTLKSANKFKGKEVPQFDYSSLPEILKPNEGDGIRIEALLYTVYHVVRDLIERVEALETKTA